MTFILNTETACEDLYRRIDEKLVLVARRLPNTQDKINFAKTCIEPIVGSLNYKRCKDIMTLGILLSKINEWLKENYGEAA